MNNRQQGISKAVFIISILSIINFVAKFVVLLYGGIFTMSHADPGWLFTIPEAIIYFPSHLFWKLLNVVSPNMYIVMMALHSLLWGSAIFVLYLAISTVHKILRSRINTYTHGS